MSLLKSYEMSGVGKLKYRILLLLFGFSIIVNAQNIDKDENKIEVILDSLMPQQTDIISFLSNSKEHSTFLKLLKATGVDEEFSTETRFTLFAPTNAAFEKLPKGTLENLMLPESKYKLTNILNYHVILGSVSSTKMSENITKNRGKAKFQAKSGGVITVFIKQGIFAIEGEKAILIESPDKQQSNGFVHIIDSVLIPQ